MARPSPQQRHAALEGQEEHVTAGSPGAGESNGRARRAWGAEGCCLLQDGKIYFWEGYMSSIIYFVKRYW